jgi:hypothetical protein
MTNPFKSAHASEPSFEIGNTPQEFARRANARCADHPRASELEWIALPTGDIKLVTRPEWLSRSQREQAIHREQERQRFNHRLRNPI